MVERVAVSSVGSRCQYCRESLSLSEMVTVIIREGCFQCWKLLLVLHMAVRVRDAMSGSWRNSQLVLTISILVLEAVKIESTNNLKTCADVFA